jgi:hypothetical protein
MKEEFSLQLPNVLPALCLLSAHIHELCTVPPLLRPCRRLCLLTRPWSDSRRPHTQQRPAHQRHQRQAPLDMQGESVPLKGRRAGAWWFAESTGAGLSYVASVGSKGPLATCSCSAIVRAAQMGLQTVTGAGCIGGMSARMLCLGFTSTHDVLARMCSHRVCSAAGLRLWAGQARGRLQ